MSTEPGYFTQRIAVSRAAFFFFTLLFLLVGALLSYFFLNSKSEVSTSEQLSPSGEEDGNAPIVIDYRVAKEMVEYYSITDSVVALSRKSPTGEQLFNPPSIHFELKALENYLDEVKEMKGADGVRVYFARYKDSTRKKIPNNETGEEYEFKNHTTVIFVTTKKNAEGGYDDILTKTDGQRIEKLIQPYNGGISCPPLRPPACGTGILNAE